MTTQQKQVLGKVESGGQNRNNNNNGNKKQANTKENLYKQVKNGYEFYSKQLQPEVLELESISKQIEKVESIEKIDLKVVEKNKKVIDNYDERIRQYQQGVSKLKDMVILGKENFGLSDKEEKEILKKIKVLEDNIKKYENQIEKSKQKFIDNLQYKIKNDFEKKVDFYKYQVEVGKLTKEQAEKEILKTYNKYKRYAFYYRIDKTEDGKKKIVFERPISGFDDIFKNFKENIKTEFGVSVGKEEQKKKYYDKLSDNYAGLFKDKISQIEKRTGMHNFRDENIQNVVKQDLENIAREAGIQEVIQGMNKNFEVLGDIKDNINKGLDDFVIEEDKMRHFLRIIPGSKLIIHLIIGIKKWGARVATNVILIFLSIFAFIKGILDTLYSYRLVVLFFLSIFLVAFTLDYTYKPAGSFFSSFVGFDYFYAPFTYALFKAFFMIIFIFYLFYVFIDVVMELTLGFNKDIAYKMKILFTQILLLLIFSSLVLG